MPTVLEHDLSAYRQQITQAAQALALARNDEVRRSLHPGHGVERVAMFVEGNLDKRRDKLSAQCDALADGFEELDTLIGRYIREIPLTAYDTGTSDGLRFVRWLEDCQELSDEQRDYVTCQRSQHTVEAVAMRQRLAHVRFQELTSLNAVNTPVMSTKLSLRVHLNPVHVWATFETHALLDDEVTIPSAVLFYPVGNEVRTAVLEPEAEDLLHHLADCGSMTLQTFLKGKNCPEREATLNLIRDLAELGILAIA